MRDFVIGNEPNLNRFWMPQFGPDGSNAAASAYLALLIRTYDALKKVSPRRRSSAAQSRRAAATKPDGIRPTHSPTTFITDLGMAYRKSGRKLPIMDSFAIHPYQDNSSVPPSFEHPNNTTIAIADYRKLVALLGKAFDGTAQPGRPCPSSTASLEWSRSFRPQKASLYKGTEPASVRPVDGLTQGTFYRDALALAFCQPNVTTFLFFHAVDEGDLDRWQSGMFYVDGTAKPSLAAVEEATRDTRGGVISKCSDLALSPGAKVNYPRGQVADARSR